MKSRQKLCCHFFQFGIVLLLVLPAYAQRFSDWTVPVSLGPTVNSVAAEFYPFVSKDGLSIYFSSDRPGGYGGWDIYVSKRSSLAEPWGAPQNLGPAINSLYDEGASFISNDGHRLYFESNRPGGFGGGDLYVSRRHNKRDDFGWQSPENLGGGVNTASNEATPWVYEDETTGITTLFFGSDRPGGPGPVGPNMPGVTGQQGSDIYASIMQPDETFGPATLVAELSSPFFDRHPAVTRDGLEIFFSSNRPGSVLNPMGQTSNDVWISTRSTTSDSWSTPVNLGPIVNSNGPDAGASPSFDGTALYFQSVRPGNLSPFFDLWVTTREKLIGREPELK